MNRFSFFALVVVSLAVAVLTTPTASRFDAETRIIGGETAATNVSPYVVSFSASNLAYAHVCAGVIIGKNWVLTVAHGINELKSMAGSVEGLPVYAGVQNRDKIENGQKRIIDFVFNHKSFDGEIGSEDIALVHVSEPFEFSNSVRYATLPYADESFDGEASATYGWGLDEATGVSYVTDLQVAKGQVLSPEACENVLPDNAPLSEKQVCVRVSACYGDGGGPLIAEREAWANVLVGLTSWGYVPCGSDRPTVYTNVALYTKWIAEVQYAYSILY